jgi:hypothetical protein
MAPAFNNDVFFYCLPDNSKYIGCKILKKKHGDITTIGEGIFSYIFCLVLPPFGWQVL